MLGKEELEGQHSIFLSKVCAALFERWNTDSLHRLFLEKCHIISMLCRRISRRQKGYDKCLSVAWYRKSAHGDLSENPASNEEKVWIYDEFWQRTQLQEQIQFRFRLKIIG